MQAIRGTAMATYGLGIDFGGTKVLAGVVERETGKILSTAKKRTNASDDADQLMDRLYAVAEDALKSAKLKASDLAGIGVGLAGQIDERGEVLLGAPNLSQSTVNLPMASLLTERFDVPAGLRNDVQVAAIGEAAFGAGAGLADFLCVFVGTGIGGAIVRNGAIISGSAGSAGEIGHMIVDANGRLCGCGGRGHLEAYASRTAITKSILGDIRRGQKTSLAAGLAERSADEPGGSAIRSGQLSKAVEAGDKLAIDTLTEAGRYLGYGLASAINLLNPVRIVMGGGVIEAVDLIFDVAAETARREALQTPASKVEIVRAGLGDNSGVVGAAIMERRA